MTLRLLASRCGLVALVAAGLVFGSSISDAAAFPRGPTARVPSSCEAPAPVPQGEIRVTFMGVSTLLLEDGRSQILVDGFFSRPHAVTVKFGTLKPHLQRINDALCRARVERLSAVLTAHAHYDHALDSAEVVAIKGGLLVGSESVANIGRGRKLEETQLKVIETRETFGVGCYNITAVPAPHASKVRWEGVITQPLVPPAEVEAYREGGNFSYLLEHRGRRILIHPSAAAYPGLYAEERADVVLLGVGGLGVKDPEVTEALWAEVVRRTGARHVIPIHWDNFTRTLKHDLKPPPWPLENFGRTRKRLAVLAAEEGARGGPVKVEVIGAFAPIVLPLPAPTEACHEAPG